MRTERSRHKHARRGVDLTPLQQNRCLGIGLLDWNVMKKTVGTEDEEVLR